MMDLILDQSARALPAGWNTPSPIALPYHLVARMVNAALTAQIQIAYACAIATSETAERTASYIEQTWPETPMRSLVAQAYRSRARERARAASEVLARARQYCGLAYAAI
jgi:hypothetical protein